MESFWMGETLKYFYLLFSPPEWDITRGHGTPLKQHLVWMLLASLCVVEMVYVQKLTIILVFSTSRSQC